jgi:hypothetical protein
MSGESSSSSPEPNELVALAEDAPIPRLSPKPSSTARRCVTTAFTASVLWAARGRHRLWPRRERHREWLREVRNDIVTVVGKYRVCRTRVDATCKPCSGVVRAILVQRRLYRAVAVAGRSCHVGYDDCNCLGGKVKV